MKDLISVSSNLEKLNSKLIVEEDFDRIINTNSTHLDSNQISEIIWLINICESISIRYSELEDAFGMGIRGMRFGLANYRDHQLKNASRSKLASYLTWYIVNAIELAAGIDNDDTRLMAKRFKEGKI